MKIKITQEDINIGIELCTRKSPCFCPIANAVCKAFNKAEGYVIVNSKNIIIYKDNHPNDEEKCFNTPLVAANFIHKFDNCEIVEPFEFEL